MTHASFRTSFVSRGTKAPKDFVAKEKLIILVVMAKAQCDQIGLFIGLWATF